MHLLAYLLWPGNVNGWSVELAIMQTPGHLAVT